MYCSPHLFPIHSIYVPIFPIIRDRTPDTNEYTTVHKTYINTLGVPHCHIAMGIFVHFSLNWTPWHLVPWPLEHNCPNQSDSQIANRWSQPYRSPTLSTDSPCPEAEHLVTTANVTPKTANSNSLLPNTASNDIQSQISSGNSCNYCINNVQTLRLRVYKQKLITSNCR
jgi:hypothetical protein